VGRGTLSHGPAPLMNKSLAIFLVGGIGAGIALQGVPAIAAVVGGLAATFDVRVYSLSSPDPAFRPAGYRLYSPPRGLVGPAAMRLRWSYLAAQFLAGHARQPNGAVLSFWGYPMGTFAVGLARMVRARSVITLLGAEAASVPSIGYGHLRRPTTRRLVLATCALASSVVVLSNQQLETMRRHGSVAKMHVIPFGADREMFEARPKSPSAPLKILHVANLTEVKDQATLLRGFSLIRRQTAAKLRVVGPDHMGGRIQQLATGLGLKDDVEFVGAVPHSALPSHYQWADLFALTSLYEGQSVALAEAAMSGVLLVSTPVGCVDDLGEDAVVVVRPGDPSDLASKVLAIASDRPQWALKVALARRWAESHDLRWTLDRLTAVIDQVSACS
jgi:glycosyltransferase involved in cell wall biosynthesis